MTVSNHARPTSVLVHAVDNKGNGDGQQDDAVQLTDGVAFVLSKGEYGNGGASENDAQVHPREEGSFVGKKDFGFNLDGRFARFQEGADFAILSLRRFLCATKNGGPKAATSVCSAVAKGIVDDFAAFSLLNNKYKIYVNYEKQ